MVVQLQLFFSFKNEIDIPSICSMQTSSSCHLSLMNQNPINLNLHMQDINVSSFYGVTARNPLNVNSNSKIITKSIQEDLCL